MNGYRRLRSWFPRLLSSYILAGLMATAVPGFEVFPFFCWFLFPITPSVEDRYALEILTLGGRSVHPPALFQDLDLVEDPFAMDAWTSIQALGRAFERGDMGAVHTLQRRLQMNFLPAPSQYRLVRLRFDPLERFRTGRIQQRKALWTVTASVGCTEIPWAR
ncbi:MAG: hypothetical protein ACFB9M_16960 [Myxococcota bacterium]